MADDKNMQDEFTADRSKAQLIAQVAAHRAEIARLNGEVDRLTRERDEALAMVARLEDDLDGERSSTDGQY